MEFHITPNPAPKPAPAATVHSAPGAGAPLTGLPGAPERNSEGAGVAVIEQQPPPPPRFDPPSGHYNKPVDNIFAATNALERIPFDNSPAGLEARRAVDLLRTDVVQQNNNPRGSQAFNSEPARTRTRTRQPEPVATRSVQRRLGSVNRPAPQPVHQQQQQQAPAP